MNRILKDAELFKSKSLPAAGASASTASIQVGPGVPESLQVKFAVEAVPSLADTKKCTTTLEHSDDDATFVAIPELATIVQTGAGGAGAAADSRTVYLPPSVKKFIRATSAVEAAGGDNTAKKVSLEILG